MEDGQCLFKTFSRVKVKLHEVINCLIWYGFSTCQSSFGLIFYWIPYPAWYLNWTYSLHILACLFQRKSLAFVITRSWSLSSYKNLNAAHYSKSIKGINTKLGILAHHDKVQLQDKEHNSESYSFGVMPLFNWIFLLERWPLTQECCYRMQCSCWNYPIISYWDEFEVS